MPDGNVIEIALDDEANAELRDAKALNEHLRSRIGDDGTYYVLLDEVQYAITNRELRDPDSPPALYGVLNGLMHLGNVDVMSRAATRRCFPRRADRVSRTWR